MDRKAWVVLIVGVATVLSQLWAMHLSNDAAERNGEVAKQQLKAAEAALRSELESVLVIARAGYTPEKGRLTVHNGGRYAAIDVRIECLTEDARTIAAGSAAVVLPMQSHDVDIRLDSPEAREAFAACSTVGVEWSDGLGSRREQLSLLATDG